MCKSPSARFRTCPWNGELFRRRCLAVGCRCFAASAAEGKDVDGKKVEMDSKIQRRRTLIDPKRAHSSQKDAKVSQMATKMQYKINVEKGSRTNRQKRRVPMSRQTILGPTFHENQIKVPSNNPSTNRSQKNMKIFLKMFQTGVEFDA